jgi:CBS domain-containing protein
MPSERTIREVLGYARVLRASPTVSVRDAARMMAGARCGSILVMAGERLLGIFTERDLLNRVVAVDRDPTTTTRNEVMTAEPDTIGPQATGKTPSA